MRSTGSVAAARATAMNAAGTAAGLRFRVGDWLVDPAACALERDGRRSAVEPRLMEVLVVLSEYGGEVVSTEQLLIECWRGTFYGDNPVHKSIAQLRRALGDSATEPRYIATVRKRGYRLVADVTFPQDFPRRAGAATARWTQGSPYVGLGAYEASHRDVFFGRARAQAEVLHALRRRLNEERAFLLVLGPSGGGKSSLLRAGVLPLLCQPGGFDGCRVLACAEVDGVRAALDAHVALADALLAWQDGDEALFLPGERDYVLAALAQDPAALAARLGERLSRRRAAGLRHAALLLLDQLEQFLLAAGPDSPQPQRLFQALAGLLRGGHIVAVAACRDDFYPRLVAVPALVALKDDGGSLDLPLLNAGEIAQIIRAPALAAGLRFDIDLTTSARLDDVLRDDAVRQPQPLPLLQHALQEIYQQRSGGTLTFAAYRAIGGLEGALAQRAEQTFAALPAAAQQQLPALLRAMVVLAGDDLAPVGRHVAWSELQEAPLRQLAQAFVEQRLFVAARAAGVAGIAAAHESLFRNWPRARDWIAGNRRLFLTRARLDYACRRWNEEGRRRDFLLPAGSQLDDARELSAQARPPLDATTHQFVEESAQRWRRQRRRNLFGLAMVLLLAAAASILGVLARLAQVEADRRRVQAEGLVGYMLGDLAERLRALGKLDVLDSVGNEALRYLVELPEDSGSASTQLLRIRASRQIGEIRFARGEAAALDAFAHALELAERLLLREPDNSDAWLELGNAAFWCGQVAYQQGDAAAAERYWLRYHAAAQRLVELRLGDAKAQLELSYALNNLATLDFDARRLEAARGRFGESAALKQRVRTAQPADDGVAADLADSLTWQGRVEEAALQLAAAQQHYQHALQTLGELRARSPEDSRWLHREALARQHLARVLLARGETLQATQLLLHARDALRRLAEADPANREWARDTVVAGLQAGLALESIDPAQAADCVRSAGTRLAALLADEAGAADLPVLQQLVQLRLLRLAPPPPDTAARQLEAMIAQLRRSPADALAAQVLLQALLARAELTARQGSDSDGYAAQARQLLDAAQQSGDAVALDLRLRAARLEGDTPAALILRQTLQTAGYRHPDYLRFIERHPFPGDLHD
nr:winged helix-turn-helix domain-containing protein [Tahibacter harae]